ncbi:MAG: hypothetical protein AB7N24_05515 [Dehalococcoidia bacterium]
MITTIRAATDQDAATLAALYGRSGLDNAPDTPAKIEIMIQTGNAFLVATDGRQLLGAVRFHDDEGIGWFDLLVSGRPWAGAELVRAVQRRCQDRGIRLVRVRCRDERMLEDYFGRLGYLPIGRSLDEVGHPQLLLERRLPLLTVREQRRADAKAIGELTGEDHWVFEQGARPGAFVASDGDTVIGFIQVADAGGGIAAFTVPRLEPAHRGRNIEVWMVSRASTYAETNGFHTAEMPADPSLDEVRKGLEDAFWLREHDRWRRIFFTPKSSEDDDWDD